MSSIRKRGKRWTVRWREAGKQREKSGFETRKAAAAWQAANHERLQTGHWPVQSGLTIDQLLEAWWDQYVVHEIAANTQATYAGHVRLRLHPTLAHLNAHTITTRDLQGVAREWAANGVSARAVNGSLSCLSSAYRHGIEAGLVDHNPVLGVRRAKETRPVLVVPTPEQVHLIASHITEPVYARLVLFAAATGLRWGELAALRWDAVEREAVRVEAALDRHMNRKTTKTRRDRRVPLVPSARALLREQRKAARGKHVWVTPSGTLLRQDNFRKSGWTPAVEAAGCDGVRFHDLRHSFASACISAGATALQVSRWVGHASSQTTFDVYGHLWDDRGTDTLTRLDDVLSASGGVGGRQASVVTLRSV